MDEQKRKKKEKRSVHSTFQQTERSHHASVAIQPYHPPPLEGHRRSLIWRTPPSRRHKVIHYTLQQQQYFQLLFCFGGVSFSPPPQNLICSALKQNTNDQQTIWYRNGVILASTIALEEREANGLEVQPLTNTPDEAQNNKARVQVMAFSPDGAFLATAADDKIMKIWDTESWKVLGTRYPPIFLLYGVAWRK